jgi:protein-tyrosine phosphatase
VTDHPLAILVVCTANICRSPMGEGLIRDAFERVGVPVIVRSAGLLDGGRSVSPVAASVLRDRGLDISAHRSTQVNADLVRAADLVLVMERHHARELSLMAPDALDRIHLFTPLTEAAAKAPGVGDLGVRAWAEGIGHQRPHRDLLGDGRPDEVRDPHGRSARMHRATADHLERGARSLADFAARTARVSD